MFALSSPAQEIPVPETYPVDLAWEQSADPGAIAYRIVYGTTSGDYTDSILVGNVLTASIPGMLEGVTYYFAAAAVDDTGSEGPLSEEIGFTAGAPLIRVTLLPGSEPVLTVRGRSGHTYEIEASHDMMVWEAIGVVVLGPAASAVFTDGGAGGLPVRLYRARDTEP